MRLKIFFMFICFYFSSISAEYYPKELDLKDVPISDVLAHLSQYSKYTFIGDSYVKDINVDGYFKIGTSIDEILNTLEVTYGLTRIRNKEAIIFRGKKSENKDILIGKVYDTNTNKEIQGVKIVLKRRENIEAYSGKFGEYIIDGINEGAYFAAVIAEQYVYDGDFIEIKPGVNRFDFYVQKKVGYEVSNKKELQQKNLKSTKNIGQKHGKNDIIKNILLENFNHKEIVQIIKETFAEKLKVSSSAGNNSIILSGKEMDVYDAENLIKELDRRKKQVRVTAEIIDVRENLFEEIGFNWGFNSQGSSTSGNNGFVVETLSSATAAGIGNVLGSSINFISSFNSSKEVLDLTLNFLETTQDLKVNALPSIILLNGEEGILKMTEEVIVGQERDEDTDTNKINSTPIFKEAGIILKVIPSVKDDKNIYLEIQLEVSDFKLKQALSTNTENSGTFNSEGGSKVLRNLNTRVRLKNNDTILIGGLKRKSDQKINNKVPFLGDIPAVGVLFRNSSKAIEYMELYIKIKAEIIEES